jgi:hypothetical protein
VITSVDILFWGARRGCISKAVAPRFGTKKTRQIVNSRQIAIR